MSGRERAIAGALLAAIVGSILFIVAYATTSSRLFQGISLVLAAAGLAAAASGWAFWVLPPEQVVDEHEDFGAYVGDRAEESAEVERGVREVTRRTVLMRFLYAALGAFAAALVVPLRSLGPAPGDSLFGTKWRRGSRLVRENGSLIHVNDLNTDSVVTVFPEGALDDAQSQTVLIRLPEGVAQSAQGYIAYSKVCTHAGCPVALYRSASRELMCPCHQSIFDVVNDGAVVSGPADHALPRLPIEVDAEGFVRATADFGEPVGPGFWSRNRRVT